MRNLAKVLSIDKSFRIMEVAEIDGKQVNVTVKRKKPDQCRICGSRNLTIHDIAKEPSIRLHSRIGIEKKVYVKFNRHRYRCLECGNKFMDHGFGIQPYWRFTGNMVRIFFRELARNSFKGVTLIYGTHYRTLERLLDEFVTDEVNWNEFKHLDVLRLGIDEHSFSGKNMVITVVELTTSTPLIILKRDTKVELKRFLHKIPWWIKRKIDEAAIDLRSRNRKAIEEELPGVNIVADRFHVVRDANMRFDERRHIQQELSSQGKKRRMKIPKKIFLKRHRNLSQIQLFNVNYYLEKYPYLRKWYEYKEKVASIYEKADKTEALKYMNHLIESMRNEEDSDFHQWAGMLSRWHDPILNYYNNKTTTAMVEGYHNPIKLLKRISFGFKNVNIYVKKIMLGLVPYNVLSFKPNI